MVANPSSQILKGILDGCVLKLISHGELYGYELNEKLKTYGLDMVSEGTIYPLLLKLQKQGLIIAESKPSKEGPNRKYYRLTEQGYLSLSDFSTHWQHISTSISQIMED